MSTTHELERQGRSAAGDDDDTVRRLRRGAVTGHGPSGIRSPPRIPVADGETGVPAPPGVQPMPWCSWRWRSWTADAQNTRGAFPTTGGDVALLSGRRARLTRAWVDPPSPHAPAGAGAPLTPRGPRGRGLRVCATYARGRLFALAARIRVTPTGRVHSTQARLTPAWLPEVSPATARGRRRRASRTIGGSRRSCARRSAVPAADSSTSRASPVSDGPENRTCRRRHPGRFPRPQDRVPRPGGGLRGRRCGHGVALLARLHLDVEQERDGLLAHAVHHRREHVAAPARYPRVVAGHRPQADALLEVVHLVEVLATCGSRPAA